MKLAIVTASLAAVLALGSVTAANAWTRNATVTTPRGTNYGSTTGSCSGGTCSRTRSVTGPNGYTASRSGSVSRTGSNSASYSRTTTGPYGNSVTRSGSVTVYPY